MQDFNFLGNRRIAHRRRLQAVAQTLIIEQHRRGRLQSRRMVLVPVVDEFGGVHVRVPSTEYLVPSETASSGSVLGTGYSVLFLLRRQRQSEHRNHPLPGDIHLGLCGIRQVERLAMLAAVDLGIRSPGFFGVATGLLDHVGRVEPALQMTPAPLAFFVFLVAGALPGLLDLHLVMGKLRRSLRARSGDFASRQRTYPRSCGARAAGFGPTSVIVLERRKSRPKPAMPYPRPVVATGVAAPE